MAYDLNYAINEINKYKDSNPALAFAIFNGFTGMGGGGINSGLLDSALRNQWGAENAKNWVNTNTYKYGNSFFDPFTGKYGLAGHYSDNPSIAGEGTLAGYDPQQFDLNAWNASNTAYGANPNVTWNTTGSGMGAAGFDPAQHPEYGGV